MPHDLFHHSRRGSLADHHHLLLLPYSHHNLWRWLCRGFPNPQTQSGKYFTVICFEPGGGHGGLGLWQGCRDGGKIWWLWRSILWILNPLLQEQETTQEGNSSEAQEVREDLMKENHFIFGINTQTGPAAVKVIVACGGNVLTEMNLFALRQWLSKQNA